MAIEVPTTDERGVQVGSVTVYQVSVPGQPYPVPIYYKEDDIQDQDIGLYFPKRVAVMDGTASSDIKTKGVSSVKRTVTRKSIDRTPDGRAAISVTAVVIVVAICVAVLAIAVAVAITAWYNGNIRLVEAKKATKTECLRKETNGECCHWVLTAADGTTTEVNCCGAADLGDCTNTKLGGSTITPDLTGIILPAAIIIGGGALLYFGYQAIQEQGGIKAVVSGQKGE